MTAAFFGHSDAPAEIKDKVREAVTALTKEYGRIHFLVGCNGNFDRIAREVLQECKDITYEVVLAYFPSAGNISYEHSIYPEILETAPKRFAIDHRNRWMISQSDIIISYITRNFGGAAKYKSIAQKQGKQIIELS